MADRRVRVLLQRDPETGEWVTYVPALGLLSTFGSTQEEALKNTREAVVGYFEAAAKEGIDVPDDTSEIIDLQIAVS